MHHKQHLNDLHKVLSNKALLPQSMSTATFDGFVAGILLCPERISPEEWVPLVLGGQDSIGLLSKEIGQTILDTLIAHFNNVAWNFLEQDFPYQLIGSQDSSKDIFLKSWLTGFFAVQKIREQAFACYTFADSNSREALSYMKNLHLLSNKSSELMKSSLADPDSDAADILPYLILHLYQWLEMIVVPNGPLTRIMWEKISHDPRSTQTYH